MTKSREFKNCAGGLTAVIFLALVFTIQPAMAASGDTLLTPVTPMELPVEVEIELSPAGSLKQAPLWKELVQMLDSPYTPVVRRPSFTATPLPPLNVYPLNYNFLTGQPMRLRTSDGEVSWDQPGPLFDPDEVVETDAFNTPIELRSVIGELVAEDYTPPGEATVPDGALVVRNPSNDDRIPPDGTIVAVPAYFNNMLHELEFDANGVWTGEFEEILELEQPVNEEHFFREEDDTNGIEDLLAANPDLPTGREAAEILGKALFWDMQVGSDGVQACGSCHFHAGADNRTKNQLNPNTLGGDNNFELFANRDGGTTPADDQILNQDVMVCDFPFHKRVNPEVVGDGTNPAIVLTDADDVMSSMGVSRFKEFVDIPAIGDFIVVDGVSILKPDIGNIATDPVPTNEGLRRVESRHTPTFHGAAFNLDNFWDGRARFNFNGGSVFGPSDPFFHIFTNDGTGAGDMHGLPNPSEETIELSLDQWAPEEGEDPVPARIKFSSLASQAVGPPLSDFEMSFIGRNWAKIGKKMLQAGVTPLANQMVDPTDSVLGPFANAGGPGLSISYSDLIRLAFAPQLFANTSQHVNGAADANDPFDGYVLSIANGNAAVVNTNEFSQMEANFSLFFAMAVQTYEELVIPDDTPADRFFDANPLAGHAVGEPGDQAVLFPTLIPDLIDDGELNGTSGGTITLVPDDPTTPEYDGFGPDEVFGFDLFAGANLTAALAPGESVGQSGIDRNPVHIIMVPFGAAPEDQIPLEIRVGSNPFTRSAKCMLCHLGPEQTDHSINISHGLLKNNAEFEYPTPPRVPDPLNIFGDGILPAPEPSGSSMAVGGLILSEEVTEGPPQDAVEVEPRNFATLDNPDTPWDDRIISQPGNFAFGDQGIYNIGLRPIANDVGRGGDDPFGWPLSSSALTLKNIGGVAFEPADGPGDVGSIMTNFDPFDIGAEAGLPGQQGFEETGDGAFFPGTTHTLQSINPGFERRPINPQLPAYLAPWVNDLPAGELHPQIDEMAGMVPNTLTPPNGGPAIEFPEIMFGADLHVAVYDPAIFGTDAPGFGWGTLDPVTGEPVFGLVPNTQSGVAGNFAFPSQGTWPVPNRVLRDGAFKAPPLRNVEMTGPYFHTGSYLTLRQVVDFYFRGGDFLVTNAENRDPHIVDLDEHAFSFGRTTGDDLTTPVNFVFSIAPPFTLAGTFADGLPDPAYLYDEYPDSNHPVTPELTFASREAALEDAKDCLVKFLIALTDPRVKYERAPFDRPQIIVPIDGTAPENTAGPVVLAAETDPVTGEPLFLNLPAVGAAGNATPQSNFLNISSNIADKGTGLSHFDPVVVSDCLLDVNNVPPVAVDDVYVATATVPLNIAAPGVLANDTDADGDPLTAVLISGPANPNGALVLNADGSFTYTYGSPIAAPVVDSFTYVANDGTANSNVATVSITVNPQIVGNLPPVANNDTRTLPGNRNFININVRANDTDADGRIVPGSVTIVTPPANGTVTVNSGGIVRYTPNPGFIGVDTFTYIVEDNSGAASNVATVTINVLGTAPIAANIATVTHSPAKINLLANVKDADRNIDRRSFKIVTPPANGSVTVKNGRAIYLPNYGFVGVDTFTYTVSDRRGLTSNVATVTVTVNP